MIDRALTARRQQSWPRWAEMLGLGAARPASPAPRGVQLMDLVGRLARAARGRRRAERRRRLRAGFAERDARAAADASATACICPFLRPFFLTPRDEARVRARGRDDLGARRARGARRRSATPALLDELGAERGEIRLARDRSRLRDGEHRGARSTRSCCPTRCSSPSTTPSRRPAPATRQRLAELFDERAGDGALPRALRRRASTAPIDALLDGAARQLPRLGRHRVSRRASRSSTGARCRPGASSRSCATRSSRAACRRSSAIRAISSSTADALDAGRADASTSSTAAC